MDDLISRSDAVDAVMNTEPYIYDFDTFEPCQKTKDVVKAINNLPSAQPEKSTTDEKSQLAEEKSTRKLIYLDDAIDAIVAWTVEDRPDAEMPTDLIDRIRDLPSAQPDLSDDGTLMMTVPNGMLNNVKRVLVDEVGTKFCKTMYQDDPERKILDELMDIMKEYYFTHRYEYDEAWENGFAKCMNLIPNVYMKRGKDR